MRQYRAMAAITKTLVRSKRPLFTRVAEPTTWATLAAPAHHPPVQTAGPDHIHDYTTGIRIHWQCEGPFVGAIHVQKCWPK